MSPVIPSNAAPIVTVFGGSGFLGRFVINSLAQRGYRIRVAVRRPDLAWYLKTLGDVSQIQPVQANVRDRESVAHAAQGAAAVINLTGILHEHGKQTFSVVHAEAPKMIAQCADKDARVVHVSALGIHRDSKSRYAQTKVEGENNLLDVRSDAVIFRPSVIFGEGDAFFNRLAWLNRLSPVLMLPGLKTLMQPVYAEDVAEAIARAVDGCAKGGTIYELGGPQVNSLLDILNYISRVTFRKRTYLNMPQGLARFQAWSMETLDKLTLGLIPDELVVTRDQLLLMEEASIVSHAARQEGRTLEGLGIVPQNYEALVPNYLGRFRKTGQFEKKLQKVAEMKAYMSTK